ncbi:MAG TPA: hypothetical protein VNO30_33475 [Kofleriaceae bacterium]|nr:hypothetical protein [Kofleriaceae bacterium]
MARKKIKQRRPRSPGWTVQLLGRQAPRRMSDTLVEFAGPELLCEAESAEEWRSVLTLAAAVWNGALLGKTSEELLKILCEEGAPAPEPELEALIKHLVRRRQTTYAQDKRFVAAVEVHRTDDEVHVTAAYAMFASSVPPTGPARH